MNRRYASRSTRCYVLLLLLISLLGVFPLDVILPSVPLLARDFDVDAHYIAYSISLFAIGVAISQSIIGPLSDRMGRKRLLIAGLIVSVAGAVGCILATSYKSFMVFREIQAVGCGCFVLSQALVQDKFSGHERNAMRILMTSASGLFISLSPLAGSVLQQYFGWAGSFQVFVLLAVVVLLLSLKLLQEQPTATRTAGVLSSYPVLLKDRAFLVSSLCSCLAFACHFSFVVVSPLLLIEQLGLTEFGFSMVFLGYGLAYMIGGFIASWLNGRVGMQAQVGWGFALIGLAGVTLCLVVIVHELGVFSLLFPLVLCTIGTTIVRPAATTHALGRHPERAGAAASLNNTMLFAFGGCASMLVASISGSLPMSLALGFVACSLTGWYLLIYLKGLERRQLVCDSGPVAKQQQRRHTQANRH
ncbi:MULTISPECIES: Bcr/CflA family efflux MFS transporter [Pseudomonas]|jgi:MFS transporter, DHA1 family, multidrug resistance protein|uniref:Bcr/CflA family efflux MFS transporter n=1 Tax=Pseudomonas TaxID=286 RepID=UPI0020C3125C|nr:Bcr/CflA family efflux MFS transporter [Pseudomonas fluorescens]UTL89384.1 Bcr/CflA family efflux MFS transporter [Pseudomonas fluorescens]